jgi:hypothetical protein
LGLSNLNAITLTIPAGQSFVTRTFTVANDTTIEGTETAIFTLSNPSSGLQLGSPTTANVVIND